MRRLRLVAVVVALAAVPACGGGQQGGTSSAPVDDTASLGMEHVHGLGVDPADGMLYAATHFGVFRLPERGDATRIADRFQDTMGFTVAGPGVFLGSGHPDFRKDPALPPRLGLIRSTDRAQTWTSVSLSGQVDFHALRYAHDTVYGSDSGTGRLLVSTDQGRTWEVRATRPLRDFAVSPVDPAAVLGTDERGVVRSTDGGRSFVPLAGPAVAVLAWPGATALYGVDPAGTVLFSSDAGMTWEQRGSLGAAPEALTAAGDVLYAAARDKGVLQSRDGGRSWTVRYRPT